MQSGSHPRGHGSGVKKRKRPTMLGAFHFYALLQFIFFLAFSTCASDLQTFSHGMPSPSRSAAEYPLHQSRTASSQLRTCLQLWARIRSPFGATGPWFLPSCSTAPAPVATKMATTAPIARMQTPWSGRVTGLRLFLGQLSGRVPPLVGTLAAATGFSPLPRLDERSGVHSPLVSPRILLGVRVAAVRVSNEF